MTALKGGTYGLGHSDFCDSKASNSNEELIKNIPPEERPREKLIARGAGALTDGELLAILLRTGTASQSALAIGRELTKDGGLYKKLARMSRIEELTQIRGLGQAKAATVLAALELGRRLASARPLDKLHFGDPEEVAAYLMPRLRYATKEQFLVMMLDAKNRIIGLESIAEGGLSNTALHPRDVFRPAILQHASAIVVAHNHPSGDPNPSKEDTEFTKQLLAAGQMLSMPLLDHVVIGDGAYYSFQEAGALKI
ncbi:MAG: DNA repair protein RadC [Phascolarctobacterium sp.]